MSKSKIGMAISFGKQLWEKHGDEIIDGVGKILDKVQKNVETEKQISKIATESEGHVIEKVGETEVEVLDSISVSEKLASGNKNIKVEEKAGKLIVVDVVDAEDTYFEELLAKLQETAENGLEGPEQATEALKILVQCSQETIKYCEEQKTKRIEILAHRDAVVAKINSITEMVKQYLDRTFDERSKQFSKQFELLDTALKTGNTDVLATTVNGINALAAESPFKSLADVREVQKSLGEGTEWDI